MGYKKLGKYDVLEVIGRGGMGVIYKGVDPGIGRPVAIKMMTGGFAESPELLQRFYREAQSAGKLQHPNIVTIHDLGVQDGNPYLVMEFLEGESLETAIKSHRPILLEDKLSIVIQICNGLGFAHKRHIVHRDIKPANVMLLKDGGVKLVDFGIARIGDQSITRPDEIMGSIQYMSPEQINGGRVDARSDIFSLGVLLYQLLTSTLPFEGKETGEILLKIIHQPAPLLSQHLADCPAELDEIGQQALAKDPEQRYQAAEDLAFHLAHVQEQLKRQRMTKYMQAAEAALAQRQLSRAEEQLLQVLEIERQNAHANALLREVQQEIQKQQRCEQACELHAEAERAIARGELDEALAYLEKAVQLDKDNAEIARLCASMRENKARCDKRRELVRRAEMARDAGDLDEARRIIEEALLVDDMCPEVRSSHAAICREIAEREQQAQVQKFLGEARQQISLRHFTTALQILREAQSLAPSVSGLQELINLAESGQQQERQRKDRERLTSEIEDALNRDDYQTACAKAEEGVRNYPGDRGLSKLQAMAAKQRETREKRNYIEATISATRRLLEERKTQEALHSLQEALARYPTELALQSQYALVSEAIERERAEQKKAEVLRKAKEAIHCKNYDKAISILDSARQQTGSTYFDDLMQFARDEATNYAKRQAIDAVLEQAHRLNSEERYQEAIDLLEKTLQEVPDRELEIILSDIRCRVEEFNIKVQEAISNARRLLRQERYADALKFLESQDPRYAKSPEFSAIKEEAQQQEQFRLAFSEVKEKVRGAISRGELDAAQEVWENSRKKLGDAKEFALLGQEIAAKRAEKANAALEMALRDARVLLLVRSFESAVSVLDNVASEAPYADSELRTRFDDLLEASRAGALSQQQRKEPQEAQRQLLGREGGSDATEPRDALPEAGPTVSSDLDDETQVADPEHLQDILGKVTVIAEHYRDDDKIQSAIGSLKGKITSRMSALREAKLAEERDIASAPNETVRSRKTASEYGRVSGPSALEGEPAAPPRPEPTIELLPLPEPTAAADRLPWPPHRLLWKKASVLTGAAVALLAVIEVAIYVGRPHTNPGATGQRTEEQALPEKNPIEARQQAALDEAHRRVAARDLGGAQQKLQEVASLDGPKSAEVRALLARLGTLMDLQTQAQERLAQGDFQSARHAADLFKENGGNPAELVAEIDQKEQRELKQLENQFDQLKQRGDDNAMQELIALQARFQAIADDGGPQSREALSFAKAIRRAIAGARTRGSQKSTGSRCEALKERVELGETLSEEERTFLKKSCH